MPLSEREGKILRMYLMLPVIKPCFRCQISCLGIYLPTTTSFKVMALHTKQVPLLLTLLNQVMTTLFSDSKQTAERLAKIANGSCHLSNMTKKGLES